VVSTVAQANAVCLFPSDVVVLTGSDLSLTDPRTFQKVQHAFVVLFKALALPERPRILGICFGYQLLAWVTGKRVRKLKKRHYNTAEKLDDGSVVYFNHHDSVEGDSEGTTCADFHPLPWTGLQWHPEGSTDGCAWLLAWLQNNDNNKERRGVTDTR
jgi:GMP synthase-like glutamine amidotransferase